MEVISSTSSRAGVEVVGVIGPSTVMGTDTEVTTVGTTTEISIRGKTGGVGVRVTEKIGGGGATEREATKEDLTMKGIMKTEEAEEGVEDSKGTKRNTQ